MSTIAIAMFIASGIIAGIWVGRRLGYKGPLGTLAACAIGGAIGMALLTLIVGIVTRPTIMDVPTMVLFGFVAGLQWGAFIGIFAAMCVWAATPDTVPHKGQR